MVLCILLHDHDNMVGIPNVVIMCKQLKISHDSNCNVFPVKI